MLKKKIHDKETAEIIQKQIDHPRMSKSARIAELDLDVARMPEPASTIMPGTVVGYTFDEMISDAGEPPTRNTRRDRKVT